MPALEAGIHANTTPVEIAFDPAAITKAFDLPLWHSAKWSRTRGAHDCDS